MRRREFIALVGGAMALAPLAARAQQPGTPIVGFLDTASPGPTAPFLAAFRQGLIEVGFVEGQHVTVEYRWAENHNDRLPALAADLVQRQVSVIVAANLPSALAAQAVTKSIPIVFGIGGDPVALGLVAGLNRPGGNVTGITLQSIEAYAKRLQLLHELIPATKSIAFLTNPTNKRNAEDEIREAQRAGRMLGLDVFGLNANSLSDVEGFCNARPAASRRSPCERRPIFRRSTRPACFAGRAARDSGGVRASRIRCGRRAYELRGQSY